MKKVNSRIPMFVTISQLFIAGLFVATLSAAEFDPGIPVGSKNPTFEAKDQNGKVQTFETIRGPKGSFLVFFRSADW